MNSNVTAVRYFSKTGNTEKLAAEIAKTTGDKALTLEYPVQDKIDILFLGASVYWGGIDEKVKEFIRNLDAKLVGSVAVFSTSALAERAYPDMKKLLNARGIKTINENFYCRGQFKIMHRNRPDEADLKAAREFALSLKNGKVRI